ncbi:MAG: VWA domain-containing protein, partial [Victivallales bacterium]|nr:VWA domain-containing protein [Victivallales bacterium]
YTVDSLYGDASDILYHDSPPRFFTTDEEEFKRGLNNLECEGDENMLLALDIAMDAPFGPANETQRVIVLISDEPFETNEPSEFEEAREKVDDIKRKLMDRHITLFAVMPVREGGIAESLAEVDRSDIIPVEEGDLGLRKVNMVDLFSQFGKTISTSTAQSNGRDNYRRALFGQDNWVKASNIDRIGDSK